MPASDQLKAAFANALGLSPQADFEALAYGQTAGWDSVAHMALITEIESAFGIALATEDFVAINSYAKAEQLLGKYGVTFSR